MNEDLLRFLQYGMLLVDGAGIFASFDRMMYYRTGRGDQGVFPIYVLFVVLFAVFLALGFSDLCVITDAPLWWAKAPIFRGHVFRMPITLVLLWMIHRQHRDNG